VAPTPIPSLNARFRALEAERSQTWSPEALATNLRQRATLVREHPATHHALPGQTVAPADLRTATGASVSLDTLTRSGPVVLVFFRFAECPACNIALPYYRDTLWPALQAAGIGLAAVSPQPFPALAGIAQRHDLPFAVLSDPGLGLARQLGITYVFDTPSREAAVAKGGTSHALNGIDAWELPKPTVLVLEPGRVVRFIDITPDWMHRTETGAILAALGLSPANANAV